MINIDGVLHNAEWVAQSLEQTADIINGENSGRLQGTNAMYLDYVGTFFNHSGQIRRNKECTDKQWDDLFLVLANPINNHTVILPFAQGNLQIEIYISQIKRKLIKKREDATVWDKVYEVTFTAMESSWLAGGEITGYME